MPAALPLAVMVAMALVDGGLHLRVRRGCLRWPMEADRSAGPMKMPCTPSTAQISRQVAAWRSPFRPAPAGRFRRRPRPCSRRGLVHSEERATALPTPRTPRGGYCVAAAMARACAAVSTMGTSRVLAPRPGPSQWCWPCRPGRGVRARRQHLLDGAQDGVVCGALAQEVQHHGGRSRSWRSGWRCSCRRCRAPSRAPARTGWGSGARGSGWRWARCRWCRCRPGPGR
jgi:hypothetical protein